MVVPFNGIIVGVLRFMVKSPPSQRMAVVDQPPIFANISIRVRKNIVFDSFFRK